MSVSFIWLSKTFNKDITGIKFQQKQLKIFDRTKTGCRKLQNENFVKKLDKRWY